MHLNKFDCRSFVFSNRSPVPGPGDSLLVAALTLIPGVEPNLTRVDRMWTVADMSTLAFS